MRKDSKEKKITSGVFYAYASFLADEPVATASSIDEVIKKAKEKGVDDPYIVEALPQGVNAFF